MGISINNSTNIYSNQTDNKVTAKTENTTTPEKPSNIILNNKSDSKQIASIGKSNTNFSFLEDKKLNTPILNIPNAKAGDKFEVDGPLWYDGNATLNKFDDKTLEFSISMKAAKKVLGFETNIPYEIKNGKVSLNVKLEKIKDNEYVLTTTDNNNNGKTYKQSVKSSGSSNNVIMTDNYGNKTTFNIKGNGNMSIKMSGAPFSIDLNKK